MRELEAKFVVSEDIRDVLDKYCTFIEKVHVYDTYYDDGTLSKDDKLLRVRRIDDKCFLTYKGGRREGKLIDREEIEIRVEEGISKIIEMLGFSKKAVAEKYRSRYVHKDFPNLKIELDEYPYIGYQLELEGDEKEIYALISILSLDKKNMTTKSCSELFMEYAKDNGLTALDFHF